MRDLRHELAATGPNTFGGPQQGGERPPACLSISTEFGDLVLDLHRFRLVTNERVVQLTRVEFDILAHLVQNAHRVVPYEELFADVIRTVHQPGASLLRVHVTHLRRKLGLLGRAVETVRGRGLTIRQLAARSPEPSPEVPSAVSANLAEA